MIKNNQEFLKSESEQRYIKSNQEPYIKPLSEKKYLPTLIYLTAVTLSDIGQLKTSLKDLIKKENKLTRKICENTGFS